VDSETLAAEVAEAEAAFLSEEASQDIEDAVVIPEDYACQQCGVPGMHLTEDCPEREQ